MERASHREVRALIPSLLIVTGRLDHGLTRRAAPETAVALWAWRSFARMAFPGHHREKSGTRAKSGHASESHVPPVLPCLAQRASRLTNDQ